MSSKGFCNINNVTNKNELISVIVPVYNVERYLKNCVESIISQTYKDLEIILVDDGSTDASGKICDNFQQKDGRVIVIHKKNGGLSDARNHGLDVANGKYVIFIDSDDYIPRYAIKYLYEILVKNKANISIGALKMTDDLNCECDLEGRKEILFDNKNAISQMLYSNLYSTSAPAKLYEKKLFDNIRFPKGRLYEDLFTIYKVLDKSAKVVYGNEIVYFYYHRRGSITSSQFTVKQLDVIDAMNEIKQNLNLKKYGAQNAFSSKLVEAIFSFFSTDISVATIKQYNLWNLVKRNRSNVLFDSCVNPRIRGYAILSYTGLKISMVITKYYYKRKWNVNKGAM